MDPTFFIFDTAYYAFIGQGKTWLHSDIQLSEHPSTAASMRAAAVNWLPKFAVAWTKLANLQPVPGTPGEVRPNCRCPRGVTFEVCATARQLARY
jgi:hypothetical protein